MTADQVVILGASHAGVQLAGALRKEKWAGDVLLIGDEGRLPYQRPPLSKAYLAGASQLDDCAIRGRQFYDKQRIELVDGTATAINRSAHTVTLNSGDVVSYATLALCTGARARALTVPGAELTGVHYLRTATDVEAIRAAVVPGCRAVIVGGGYIGLETAASLRAQGVDVTVLEAAERVLERVTAPVVSRFFDRTHRTEGVDVRTSALVEGFRGEGRVEEVVLADGETLAADLDGNWEVLGEAVQTAMRAEAIAGREGMDNPYERLKELTRGHRVDAARMRGFIAGLGLSEATARRLSELTPGGYTGLAEELVDEFGD